MMSATYKLRKNTLEKEKTHLIKQYGMIEEELQVIRNNILLTSGVDRLRSERQEKEKKDELEGIRIKIKEIERKLENLDLQKDNFPQKLYEYFTELNYDTQRENFIEHLDTNSKTTALLIHGHGKKKYAWLWGSVFLTFPRIVDQQEKNKAKRFKNYKMNRIRGDIFSIVEDFLYELSYEGDELEDGIDDAQTAVETLYKAFKYFLSKRSVLIPFIINPKEPNYSVLQEFTEKIWKPLCHKIEENPPRYWILLLLIYEDLNLDQTPNFISDDLVDCYNCKKIFLMNKIDHLNESEFEKWVKSADKNAKGILYRHRETIAKRFLNRLKEPAGYKKYLPNCLTVEGLFEKMCEEDFKLDFHEDVVKNNQLYYTNG